MVHLEIKTQRGYPLVLRRFGWISSDPRHHSTRSTHILEISFLSIWVSARRRRKKSRIWAKAKGTLVIVPLATRWERLLGYVSWCKKLGPGWTGFLYVYFYDRLCRSIARRSWDKTFLKWSMFDFTTFLRTKKFFSSKVDFFFTQLISDGSIADFGRFRTI